MANNLTWAFELIDRMSGPAKKMSAAVAGVEKALKGIDTAQGAMKPVNKLNKSLDRMEKNDATKALEGTQKALEKVQDTAPVATKAVEGAAKAVEKVGKQVAATKTVSGLDRFKKGLDNLHGSSNKAAQGFRTAMVAGGAFAATVATVAAVGGGQAAVAMLSSAENTRLALTSMLGSTEKATNAMQYAIDLARTTPLEVGDVVKSMQRLIQQGFAPNQIDPLLRGLADMGAQLGMTGADVNDLVTIIGQIKMKPKLQAEELLQLAERGVPAYQMLAKQLGVTEGQVVEMASKGMISGATAVAALTKGMDMFSGASQRNSTTLSGLISTLQSIPQEFFLQMDIQSARGGKDILAPVRNLLSNVAELFNFAKEPGKTIFSEASGAISGLIKAVFGPLATSSDPQVAGAAVMRFIDSVKEISAQVTPIFNSLKTIVAAVFPVVSRVFQALMPMISGAITALGNFATWAADAFKNLNPPDWLIQGVALLVGGLLAMGPIAAVVASVTGAASTLFGVVSNGIKIIQGIGTAMRVLGMVFAANPIGLVLTLIAGAVALIWANWSTIGPLLQKWWDTLVSKVQGAWTAIATAVSNIVNGIKTGFTSLITTLANIGTQIVQGLVNGLIGGVQLVTDAITNLGQSAVNGIKSLLGIKSPSTVFEGLGLDTAAGLERGLLLGQGMVSTAADNLASAAIPNVGPQNVLAGLAGNPTAARTPAMGNVVPRNAPVGAAGGGGGISGPVTVNINVTANNTEPKGVAEQIKVIAVSAILEALEGASMEGGLWQTSS